VPLNPGLVERFRRRYHAITAEGIAFHQAQPPLAPAPAKHGARRRGRKRRRTGHNLVLRLQAGKEDTAQFPDRPRRALHQQSGRAVRQKISGGFRSQEGAHDFAVIRSFISTAKKQGWNVIQALMLDSETLIARLRTA
jgi:transposase